MTIKKEECREESSTRDKHLKTIKNHLIILALDSEYQQVSSEEEFLSDFFPVLQLEEPSMTQEEALDKFKALPQGKRGSRRLIVSLQLMMKNVETGMQVEKFFRFRGREVFEPISLTSIINRMMTKEFYEGHRGNSNDKSRMKSFKMILVAHYNRFDVSWFTEFRRMLDDGFISLVQGTLLTIEKPFVSTVSRKDSTVGKKYQISVTVRDTKTLADNSSLASLGECLGMEKESHRVNITRMFFEDRERPHETEKYGMKDCRIVIEWSLNIMRIIRILEEKYSLTGIFREGIPATLSSVAVKVVHARIAEEVEGFRKNFRRIHDGASKGDTYGSASYYDVYWKGLGSYGGDVEKVKEQLYKGGLNGAGIYGLLDRPLHDVDIKGAYPMIMKKLGVPDWENGFQTEDLETVLKASKSRNYAFGRASWEYPPDETFPTVSMSTIYGLVNPLTAHRERYQDRPNTGLVITGIELESLIASGARVILHDRWTIIPQRDFKPFKAILDDLTEMKDAAQAAGDIVSRKIYKLIANSLYGQIARGISGRKRFDWEEGESVELGPSTITSPLLASYITASIRICLAELVRSARKKDEESVGVWTTDGLLTAWTPEWFEKQYKDRPEEFPGWTWMEGMKGRLETKASVRNAFIIKTRTYFDTEGVLSKFPGISKRDQEGGKMPLVDVMKSIEHRLKKDGIKCGIPDITGIRKMKPSFREFKGNPGISIAIIENTSITMEYNPDFKMIPKKLIHDHSLLKPPTTTMEVESLREWMKPRKEGKKSHGGSVSTTDLLPRAILRIAGISRIPATMTHYLIAVLGDRIGDSIPSMEWLRNHLRGFEVPEEIIAKITKRFNRRNEKITKRERIILVKKAINELETTEVDTKFIKAFRDLKLEN